MKTTPIFVCFTVFAYFAMALLTASLSATPARAGSGIFDLETKLTASDAAAHDRFGFSVAISGNTALVGERLDDDRGINSGSAYLFENVIPEPSGFLLASLAGLFALGTTPRRRRK